MNRRARLVLLVAFLAASQVALSTEMDLSLLQGLGDSRYHRLDVDERERTYHLFVRLPESYAASPDQTYPTIYLLDGGTTFPLLAAYYHYLQLGGDCEEAILVGISYGTDEWKEGNFRSTDFTAPSSEREYWGGAGAFQEILKERILPLIESSYRSRSDRRILFGQSLGGQFVLYSAMTQPNLFWGRIASNPALHRNLDFFLEAKMARPKARSTSHLFVSSGSLDDERFRVPALKWMKTWESREQLPWRLKTMTLEGESHFSAAAPAFRQGLLFLQETAIVK